MDTRDVRFSRVTARYEIGTETTGLENTATNRHEAFEVALAIANARGCAVTVADTMARRGMTSRWVIQPGSAPPSR